jgi:hypothetical protein
MGAVRQRLQRTDDGLHADGGKRCRMMQGQQRLPADRIEHVVVARVQIAIHTVATDDPFPD